MQYDHLTPWKCPPNYGGAQWNGWAPVLSRTRDSDPLEESNYAQAYQELGCQPWDARDTDAIPSDVNAVDTRAGHWAVGWVETIYVRLGSPEATKADTLLSQLEDPVLDEEDSANGSMGWP